jgi:hypothetical protein
MFAACEFLAILGPPLLITEEITLENKNPRNNPIAGAGASLIFREESHTFCHKKNGNNQGNG